MVTYLLIGGKKNLPVPHKRIESLMVKMSGKENPSILFCPYAVPDEEKSILKFHKLMEGISCTIKDIRKNDASRFEECLASSDILYIGGGCSDDLLAFFKEHHLDEILRKYVLTDKIYAGSSAGAMLYCRVSMGDKYMYTDNYHNYNYKMVDGLGLLNISMCPHYQNEDLIIYNDEIKKYALLSFGIEEDTALVIKENKYSVLKDDPSMGIYSFDPESNYKMNAMYEGEEYENSRIRSDGDLL